MHKKPSLEKHLARHRRTLSAITSGCSSLALENDRLHGSVLVLELEVSKSFLIILINLGQNPKIKLSKLDFSSELNN